VTRVLVLGQTGMVGHMVVRILSRVEGIEVEGTERRTALAPLHFEAASGAEGLRTLWRRRGSFRFVVNCIGLTRAELDEYDPRAIEAAIRVNAILPHQLAAIAAEFGARVLHISTDGVFSGAASACAEDAPHNCWDVYGKTKSLGEVMAPEVLTLRCSIVGPDPSRHRGLLEWFLSLPDGKEVIGYTDSLWNGVTSLQLALLCQRIIEQAGAFTTLRAESPVHHFCPNRALSKYQLLLLFGDIFQRRVVVTPGPTPGGPVTRLLVSRYQGLRELFGAELEMADALKALTPERTTR
jgi:dTDP-4-dehydrorhamnose reductase